MVADWLVFVVGDEPAAEVRGDHLGRLEVRAGERRLPGPGDADEDHQAQLGNAQLASLARGRAHAAAPCPREHGELRRRPGDRRFRPGSGEPDGVSVVTADPRGPVRELGAVPLETMVAMAQRAFRHAVLRVVLPVGGGDHHRRGRGEPENHPFERPEPVRLHVLDHLGQHGRVQVASRSSR